MISFEFHLEKWHEKTQKPLWFLGFPNRYLFRFAMLVAGGGFEPPNIPLRCPKCADLAIARRISTAAAAFASLYRPPDALLKICSIVGELALPILEDTVYKLGQLQIQTVSTLQVIRPRAHNPPVGSAPTSITKEKGTSLRMSLFLWQVAPKKILLHTQLS